MITLTINRFLGMGSYSDRESLVPDTLKQICRAIEAEISPPRKAIAAKETLEDIGETVPESPVKEHDGSFDRTPLVALGEWCADNDEPMLERACKFLIKHTEIRAQRKHYYSDTYQVLFLPETLPSRWKHSISASTAGFLGLLCNLADEIEERLQDIEADLGVKK